MHYLFWGAIMAVLAACYHPADQQKSFDIIIRNGVIYDGTGAKPFKGDIAIYGDTIAAVGDLSQAKAKKEIDADGLAIAPGFINPLSWANESLLEDGRSLSNIKQGVTLEVFGEGWSPGPVKRELSKPIDSLWTTLGGYFNWLMKKGVSTNVASFVGHTSVRNYVLGFEDRSPSPAELEKMKKLVGEAMEEGALGLGVALIYPPASYASTDELIELAKVASAYNGIYATHMRSEGDFILQALDETFLIAQKANIPVMIHHLKINIARNWNKIDTVLFKIDSARKAGLAITANMYPYTASGTGLTSRLPNWVQEGGAKEMRKRLRNKTVRQKVLFEMKHGIPYKNSDPKDVVLLGFRLDSLDELYKGKRLNEVARLHGKNADETVIDLVMKDKSRIEALYFLMSEDNVRKIVQLPYVCVGSDAPSLATPANVQEASTHPRTYGTFARILGKYVREEKLITLEEAIRKMTSLPASILNIRKRGGIRPGFFADLVILDAALIRDMATFENPHEYAQGVVHVFVNGTQVLDNGTHTGAMPGRVIYGAGFRIGNKPQIDVK